MYINSGYLNNSRLPFKDKSKPLIVGSCGTYRLRTKERLPTWRPRGRLDYQLLYVASGKTVFYFNGEPKEVAAGHMILFRPRQEQHYEYFAVDRPEVYWVHFTGSDVRNILRHYDIPLDRNVIYSGSSATYAYLFKEMINELQTCRTGYQELLEKTIAQYHERRKHLPLEEAGAAQEEASDQIIQDATKQALDILNGLNADRESFRQMGLTFEEKAFYDILIHLRDEHNFEYGTDGKYGNDKCKSLAKKIKKIIDTNSAFSDWLNNQRVRDRLKQDIKICLIKNGYPPQYSPVVFQQIMGQVENFKEQEM